MQRLGTESKHAASTDSFVDTQCRHANGDAGDELARKRPAAERSDDRSDLGRLPGERFRASRLLFAIWGVIYLGLIAFVAYQFTPAGRLSPAVRRVGGWFALSNIANALWIVFWHNEIFPATMAAMLVLLVSLCAIVARLQMPRNAASAGERWLVYLPFSVYLGWISVATIANAFIFLIDLGWDGRPLSSPIWGLLLLGMATGLGAWMVLRRGDLSYTAVLVWAFVGIAIKQHGVDFMPAGAWAGVGVLLGLVGWRTLSGRLTVPAGPPAAHPY